MCQSCQTWPAKFGQILLGTDTRLVFCNRKLMRTDIFFTRATKPICNFANSGLLVFVINFVNISAILWLPDIMREVIMNWKVKFPTMVRCMENLTFNNYTIFWLPLFIIKWTFYYKKISKMWLNLIKFYQKKYDYDFFYSYHFFSI